jgi:DNA-directed RNA polymerase subunit RPC12/RpoP
MSVQDLFGTEKKVQKKAAKPAEDEFSLGGLTDLEAGQETEEGQQNKCPKCGTVEAMVIFCPECGTAFCENCAKRVQAMGKTKTFVCPSCKAKIKK